MVKKNTEAATSARPDVANQPRQSQVAFADYVNTLAQHAPERLADIVAPDVVDTVSRAIDEAGENFRSTTTARIEKVIADKVEQAVAALTKEDALTGYAGFTFDPEAFAAKTAPKKGRARLSPEAKAARIAEQATPEQLDALAALLKERGLA